MSTRHSEQVFVTDRSCTDILALILVIGLAIGYVRLSFSFFSFISQSKQRENTFALFFISLLQGFLVSNAEKKGDVFRVINGYDNCGNVCGRVTKGETDPEFQCKGKDMTKMR